MKNIVIIGAGNVATHLAQALYHKGLNILQVWSRTLLHAQELAEKVAAEACSNLKQISSEAELYIFAVKDDALASTLEAFPFANKKIVHTAGSLSSDLLKSSSAHYGVFYPLQTFSKHKAINFREVPILIEASTPALEDELKHLALQISDTVQMVSSEQRKYLHISAVFACNFSNYFYSIAQKILESNELDFDLIRPLILETAQKAMIHAPADVQTGPAIRRDTKIVNAHIEMLDKHPQWQKIYTLLSHEIMALTKA